MLKLFLILLLLPLSLPAQASVQIRDIRTYQAPDHLRVVLDVSGKVEHRLFSLSGPDRLVVDLDETRLGANFPEQFPEDAPLSQIRSGRQGDGLRVVFDLKRKVRPKTFLLQPGGQFGHRLVIDLFEQEASEQKPKPKQAPQIRKANDSFPWVIAIDAGHGGEDPGAIGKYYRTREKDVVLAIARELQKKIDATPNMQAVMTRDGDYYVGLAPRHRYAKDTKADLFVSIHADAVPGKRARGASVYVLSQKGASDTISRMLANSENAADVAGGYVAEEIKDPMTQLVLYDLSMSKNMPFSREFGEDVLAEIGKVNKLHRRTVGHAGFMVLNAAATPSILVETAFISNPIEEKKLRSRDFQRSMAEGILRGIKRFLARNNFIPNSAREAASENAAVIKKTGRHKEHIVRRGDSLSSIARKYNVHVDTLRFANNLTGTQLPVGRKLLIP
ncbi:MAG: N-acetylmuramoyl-L-alanine amidase [Gammaproteobacteria bacterium]|nr:N-acetylmuramoyl-L-alanine amidase [Gammaproteobacteria bacterium]